MVRRRTIFLATAVLLLLDKVETARTTTKNCTWIEDTDFYGGDQRLLIHAVHVASCSCTGEA